MDGLNQFVASIVEATIDALHQRGLLMADEGEEVKAARLFHGKMELSIRDLAEHPACRWSRQETIRLLMAGKIKDVSRSSHYKISALSVYRYLTQPPTQEEGKDFNRPRLPYRGTRGRRKGL